MKCLSVKIFVVLLSVCFITCKDEYSICNEVKEVKFTAGLFQRVAGIDVLTTAPNFSLLFLNGPSSIYTNQSLNSFSMPLITGLDSAKYIISFSTAAPKDTMTILYTTQDASSNLDCGRQFFYTITNIQTTTNTVDSIKIINTAVNASLSQNAKIYF
jgi:hypothetical protein